MILKDRKPVSLAKAQSGKKKTVCLGPGQGNHPAISLIVNHRKGVERAVI